LGGGLVAGMIGGSSAWSVEGAGMVGTGAPSYKGFRFPVEIISHCVWLYHRFPLSFKSGKNRGCDVRSHVASDDVEEVD
jgi:hypothetical protein